jgi:hypothetical protein
VVELADLKVAQNEENPGEDNLVGKFNNVLFFKKGGEYYGTKK